MSFFKILWNPNTRYAYTIAVLTISLISMSSCSNKQENSAPKVKTEIYGTTSDDTPEKSSAYEKSEPITLNYAVFGQVDTEEYELIKKFNESDNGYVIVTKDYSEIAGADENSQIVYDADRQRSLTIALMQDISNGEIDIVRDYYLGGSQNMNIFSGRGAFIDLYKFMEKDSEVNTATLNSHVLELHETDGKLYTLPTYFTVETLIGQAQYVGDKEGWTLDELISHWEQMPEGSTIEGHTEKDYVYYTILRGMLDSFIDYKNAAASFDSSEFRKVLEFCNTFNSINDTYSDPDFNALGFVSSKRFYGFADTHVALWNAESEPYTFVGYPSDDGCGGFIDTKGNRFAICASTTEEEQQGAWEFIRTYCLDEYQTEHYCQKEKIMVGDEVKEVYSEPVGFPINLKVYDEIAKDSMNGEYMDSTISMQGNEYEIGQLTQEELDRLTNYINQIQNLSVGIDNDLDKIINEEIIAYFNGEISIDECIDYIQNRTEIMISEKQ